MMAAAVAAGQAGLLRRFFSTGRCLQVEVHEPQMVFDKFSGFNKRGTKQFKKDQFKKFGRPGKHKYIPHYTYGTRQTGIRHHGYWESIPEMVPELIVPDLTDCQLKPYVSYATKEIYQEELTSRDLFNVIYAKKVIRDYKNGGLDSDGNSLEPSTEEKMTAEEAVEKAKQTGSDIFQGGEPISKNVAIKYDVGKL